VSFPSRVLLLSRLSASFAGRTSNALKPPESLDPCWCAVATKYPLGNCDSPGSETVPGYLTRLEAVSNRFSSPSPSFAFDDARTSSEELVNSASTLRTFRSGLKRGRANQPDSTVPQSPGIILETSGFNISCRRPFSLEIIQTNNLNSQSLEEYVCSSIFYLPFYQSL
jgi:hypothetical protein